MTQSNVDTIHAFYAAFAQGDVPTVLAMFSPEIVWEEPGKGVSPWGGIFHSPNEVVEGVFMKLLSLFDEVSVLPDEIFSAGDTKVLALGHIKGKSKETGKWFDSPFAHVQTFQDGKITKMDVYEDVSQFTNALS